MEYKKYSYLIVLVVMLLIGINKTYADEIVTCEGLFGSPSNPNSIRYIIDQILLYPKIIVPILVILLGALDLGKAVISNKEDEMKKAQSTFIKRVIIGIVIFFIPTILDILMSLAEIVWAGKGNDTSCLLK